MGRDSRTVPCPAGCGNETTYEVVTYQGAEYPSLPPICSLCADRERRQAEETVRAQERAVLAAEARKREAEILDLLHRAGVNPWEHGRASLDTFDCRDTGPEPLEAARRFLARTLQARGYDPVEGLLLIGPTGTGKTHLAVGIARAVLLDPRWSPDSVLFVHTAGLITDIQDAYGSSDRSVREIKRRLIQVPLLILDDLGTERPTDDVARILTEILTLRAMRPTLGTSNYTPDELEARHPELWRLGSRLGPAYFERVEVVGTDRRHVRL